MLTIIILVLLVLSIISAVVVLKDRKDLKKRMAEPPKPKTTSVYHWVVDTENANRFVKAYKHDLEENDDYSLSAKELREDYEGEKVYKYEPLELPCKLEGHDVYSYIDENEWIKVGRLKKNADSDGEIKLRLFVNIYKYVTENSVEKESDEPYFGVEVIKKDIL